MEQTDSTITDSAFTELSPVYFRIILFDAAGAVVGKRSARKVGRIHYLLNNSEWVTAWLKVTYDEAKQIGNEGYYASKQELREALSAFTELALREYLAGGVS